MFRQDKNVQTNPLLKTCQNISVNYQLKDQIHECGVLKTVTEYYREY